MKKVLSLVLISILALAIPLSESQGATAKAGAPCIKVGATSTVSGVRYTCIKSGKKLIWNQGVKVIAKPTSSPSATPSTTPTPTASPTPSATPSPSISSAPMEPIPNNLLTFQNLLANYKDIPGIAFENTQLLMKFNQGKATSQTFTFRVAPGLTADATKYQEAIKKGQIFFAGYPQPTGFLGILYTAKDMDWAKEVFDKETGSPQYDMMVKAPFGGNPNSTGGGANANLINNLGVTVFGYYQGFDTDPFVTSMAMAAHEYVHQVQIAQFNPNKGDQGTQSNNLLPCWITEGQANFNGIGVVSADLSEYQKLHDKQAHSLTLRNATVTGGQSELSKAELTPEYISKYYDAMNISANNSCITSSQYGLGYSLGMLTIEALSTIKGPRSSMLLIQKLALGETFEEAFLQVYGVKWADVKEILAQVVSKELQAIL